MSGGGGQPLRIGPFLGGLNTSSDPTAIADAELVECLNFELDIDGSLESRPPFQEIAGHASWTERILMIGVGIFDGTFFLIGSNINGVFHYNGVSWTLITNTFEAAVAVQYADSVFLVPKPGSGPGGKWSPALGFTAITAIPNGQSAVIHKERLFVVPGSQATGNESRLTFSNPGDFETWDSTNFIDVVPGDGSNLVDITVYQDNLLLFKNFSTFVLAYDTDPATAVLRRVSLTIGAEAQHNVVNYENQIYVFHQGWVYEVINYDFHRLNTKVPFIRDATAPTPFADEDIFLSQLADRIICRFLRKIYVYGLRTRTWSEWEAKEDVLHYFGPIVTLQKSAGLEFYAGSALQANTTVIRLFDEYAADTTEEILEPASVVEDTFTRTVVGSWGTSDSGHTWSHGGSLAGEYDTNGTEGTVTLTGASPAVGSAAVNISLLNFDTLITVDVNQLATGGWMFAKQIARSDGITGYVQQLEFKDDNTLGQAIYKFDSGGITVLGSASFGAYAADEKFRARFQVANNNIRGKIWREVDSEPSEWNIEAFDNEFTTAGFYQLNSEKDANNTNVNPIMSFDNIDVRDADDTTKAIECSIRTKNFDMAVSHQFKRLWWWGVDVITDNDITGTAEPIQATFNVSWQDLANSAWQGLNTWAQPLTTPATAVTVRSTGTGVARRFAKFLKGLRYRQINFAILLTTTGSTVDGPARIFSLTAITETKQTVSKAVS